MQEKKDYNAAIYARLSKEDEKAGESVSIGSQVAMLTKYVADKGWNLAATFKDDGYSGTSFDNRPAFQEMMSKVRKGEINLVVVKDLSRFGRDYIEVGQYIDIIFPSLGCRFIAVNDNVDTLSKGNDMLAIFKNVMNDFYARDTSAKIRAVRQSCARFLLCALKALAARRLRGPSTRRGYCRQGHTISILPASRTHMQRRTGNGTIVL